LDSRYQENGSNLLTGGWTHMFSNSAVLDTSLGFTERWDNRWYPNTAQFAPSTIGLPSYMDNMVNRTYQNQLPNLTISGLSNWLGNPSPMSITRNISLRSGLSYVNGSHTYTLGGEVRQQMRSETSSGNSSGLFAFDNSFTRQYSDSTGNPQGLGLASAAFLLGLPTSTRYDYYTPYKAHDPYFAFYAQDAWRVTPKLTVSLGLRYEYEYGPVEISNREATYWDPTAALPIASHPRLPTRGPSVPIRLHSPLRDSVQRPVLFPQPSPCRAATLMPVSMEPPTGVLTTTGA
jgi:outer membrane receptor protein involved in Fe transport